MARSEKSEISNIRQMLFGRMSRRGLSSDKEKMIDMAIRSAMAKKRRSIKRIAGGKSGKKHTRVAAKRFAKDQARQLKKEFARRRNWAIPFDDLVMSRISSPILDRLDPKREKEWRPIVARRFRRETPRVQVGELNFLERPLETLNEFLKISQAERSEVRAHLDFVDTHCVDIGAYLVFSEIWPQLSKIFVGGRMSRPVQKVLSAIRLDEELGIGLVGVRDHRDVWAFPVRHRRPRGKTTSPTANLEPQDREKVADELCNLIDEWLLIAGNVVDLAAHPGWELSDEGRSLIARMSGELLDNAERHSVPGSADGDWSMTAFMALRENDQKAPVLRCYLAFLNVGQSIAEAMDSVEDELAHTFRRYTDQFGRRGPSRNTLLTVLALQDAITSNDAALAAGRGGTGLQDVIEFISELGIAGQSAADACMTIVSGSSCIRLKAPYLVGARDNRGKRVQWCNEANEPTLPPDPEIAFDLPRHFAGTLVSVGFSLDPRLFVNED